MAKGHISVNAEEGMVFLRRMLDREEDIERAATAARAIDGVREIENLMAYAWHAGPGEPHQAAAPV